MPLFFLIAIGCGAVALGATTLDVTSDTRAQHSAAAPQTTSFQASAYATHDDCLRAAAQQGVPASAYEQS
jgi:hypothetical protein